MAGKMKKFNIRGMLDGLRQSVGSSSPKSETEIEETLRSEHLQVCKTVRHGFPFQPTAVAFDAVQHILAVGTKSGSLRIFGQAGVDLHCQHDTETAVLQILFLVNEGALVTCCSDDTVHLWNYRQKRPEIVHSLKFQRERITFCHLSFQSKWLYVGSERGNVHIVNIESFTLSGYVINWNKAIELSRKAHPGPVVHLSDNPLDPSKLLIGFESGVISFWDLKSKTAECRFCAAEALRSISWHHEGRQFMGSHTDGSLTTWNIRAPGKPVYVMTPHTKVGKDGKPDPCKPIAKVEWKSVRNSEPLVIFSGGMSYDRAGKTPCITVMTGKTTTVLEMEHTVVDFCVLCETPWQNDFQDPYAIVVLLQNDLVVIDLTTTGYPCFENPYPMDIHESPVTACQYFADCPTDLIPAFYSVGSQQKRTGFSDKCWPIKGGEWGTATCSYPEIVITGHADGSVKFWDASAVTLQVLYKVKSAKIFEKPKNKTLDGQDDDPFAVYLIHMDLESRLLCLAGATHCMLFKFSKTETTLEVPCLDISIVYEVFDDIDSPDMDYPKPPSLSVVGQHQQSSSVGSCSSNASDSAKPNSKPSLAVVAQQQKSGSMGSYSSDSAKPEQTTALKVRPGVRKWGTGYQPDMVCILTWLDNEHPGNVTSISVNSSYGLLAFGNESGLAIVDVIQRTCLLNLGTPDLYGSMDPYQRAPRSPRGKRPQPLDGSNPTLYNVNDEGARSPTSDQFGSNPGPTLRVKPTHLTLGAIVEGGSVDSSQVPITGEHTLNQETALEQSEIEQENQDDVQPVTTPDLPVPNVNVMSPTAEHSKKRFSKRTMSLPLVQVLEQKATLSSSISNEASVGTAPAVPVTEDNSTGESYSSSDIKATGSVPDLKPLRDGQSRKYSFKNIKQRLKHKRKGHKSDESHTLVMDPNDSDSQTIPLPHEHNGTVPDEHDSRSETENNPLTDEDLLSPSPVELFSPSDGKEKGFFRHFSMKVKQLVIRHDYSDDDEIDDKRSHRKEKINVIDLCEDNNNAKIVVHRMTVRELTQPQVVYLKPDTCASDKNDGSSFSRSRSSSMSSLENVSKEAIQCLVFADSYTRKFDNYTSPCLWVGTSLGSVLVIVMNLPPDGEQRLSQPVIVSPSGTIFRLKGSIQAMSFLDCTGQVIPTITSGLWREKEVREEKNSKLSTPLKLKISPSSSTEMANDRQFAIICSEKQARVVSLPSQTCPYKVRISESSFIIKADIISLRGDSVCLSCYVANGHIMVYSLPSLKLLLDVNFLPLTEMRVARTFSFSNHGHALYMCSPTELQKVTYSADYCDNLGEMLGDLFLPTDAPDAPRQGFFKNLFTSGSSPLDRQELFGEASGKGPRGLATRVAGTGGMQHLQAQAAGTVGGEVSRARQLLSERGEKLAGMGDRTEEMAMHAESFASAAHQLMQKYKDKKWYQF